MGQKRVKLSTTFLDSRYVTEVVFVCSYKVYINSITVVCATTMFLTIKQEETITIFCVKMIFHQFLLSNLLNSVIYNSSILSKSKEKCTTIFLSVIPYACNSITMCEIVYSCAFIILLLNCIFRTHYHKCCTRCSCIYDID